MHRTFSHEPRLRAPRPSSACASLAALVFDSLAGFLVLKHLLLTPRRAGTFLRPGLLLHRKVGPPFLSLALPSKSSGLELCLLVRVEELGSSFSSEF